MIVTLLYDPKQCPVCGKIFHKRQCCTLRQWEKQITCSRECRVVRMKFIGGFYKGGRPQGIRQGKHVCCLCNKTVIGGKPDLLRHKYEEHGYE
jgi:hypothetical protein